MKDRRKFLGAAAMMGVAAICCTVFSLTGNRLSNIGANTASPTIHMDHDENYLFESVTGSETRSGSSSVTTGYGNTVAVDYVDFVQMRTAVAWHLIGANGYFCNTDRITGLNSISFALNNTGTITVSWSADGKTFAEGDSETISVETAKQVYTCYFGGDSPNYFRFANSGTGLATVISIDIAFACVNYYPTITVEPNDAALGTVKGGGAHKIGSTVSLEATPVEGGSTFFGWYEGGELLSFDNPYKYTVPDYEAVIVGRFEAAKYNLVVASEDTEMGSVSMSGGEYLYGESVTVSATPNEGYSFVGWYRDGVSVSTSAEYTFPMPAESIALSARFKASSYYVSLTSENTSRGSVSESGYHDYKSSVTVTATHKSGYSFVGWFENGEWVSSLESYTFTMPARDVSLVAKWSTNSYVVTVTAAYVGSDGETAYGTVSGSGTYAYNSRQTATAVPSDGFAFLGWYEGETLLSESENYAYNVPSNDLTLVAKFSKKYTLTLERWSGPASAFVTGAGQYGYGQTATVDIAYPWGLKSIADENLTTIECGGKPYSFTMPENDVTLYYTVGFPTLEDRQSYEFGSYPQTCVTDETLISSLSSATDSDNDGYIEYGGKEYLKTLGSGKNDYDASTTYYFAVEPITWKYYGGMLKAEKIIDASVFYTSTSSRTYGEETVYANNYMYSTVRAYLNGLDGSAYNVGNFSGAGFIDKAFTADEQAMIKADAVDNSAATTDDSSNSYACANTEDKIFLLSYQDEINLSTITGASASRVKKYTDYALYRGLEDYNSSTGAGRWWLRSPRDAYSSFAWSVLSDGSVNGWLRVSYSYGLFPALRITL